MQEVKPAILEWKPGWDCPACRNRCDFFPKHAQLDWAGSRDRCDWCGQEVRLYPSREAELAFRGGAV